MLLQLKHITKRFPGILANDRISLDVRKGEIHAIVGENGAGKSTLMNVLYGLLRPDEGDIVFKGQTVHFHSPSDAIACGIGMVHQHFMLIPTMTVTENIMLGTAQHRKSFVKHIFLDKKTAKERISSLSECFGLSVDPDAKIADLAVGARQRVEIIKALYRKAELLILDEPTSVLTPQETSDFFRILKTLVQAGMSVIFITHKLQEVMQAGSRATVLRNGHVVRTVNVGETSQRGLAQMMVGRGVLERLNKKAHTKGAEVLRVEALSCCSAPNLPTLDDISFSLRGGEILGIAGVSGNGQTELAETLSGLRKVTSGKIWLKNQEITNASPRRAIDAGVSHIPEERQSMGLVMDFPLYDNAILGSWFERPFSNRLVLDKRKSHAYTQSLLVSYDVKAKDIRVAIHELSGGNQQKFVVGRELDRSPNLLLAVQPSRGVDIGSTEFIHQKLLEERERGVAILLISTELDEIFALSDRIAVMYKGKIVDIVDAASARRETIGLMMAGVRKT